MICACGTCVYWQQLEDGDDAGECRRHPPVILDRTPVFTGAKFRACCVWPATSSADWCGDWISGQNGEATQ